MADTADKENVAVDAEVEALKDRVGKVQVMYAVECTKRSTPKPGHTPIDKLDRLLSIYRKESKERTTVKSETLYL